MIFSKKWLKVNLLKNFFVIIATVGGVLLDLNTRGELENEDIRIYVGITIVTAIVLVGLVDLIIAYVQNLETEQKIEIITEKTKEQALLIRDLKLQKLLAIYVRHIAKDNEARACVLVPDKAQGHLYIYETWGEFSKEELALTFRTFQGLSGHIFSHSTDTLKNLTAKDLTVDQLRSTWKMEDDQIKHTQHIQCMLGAPIERRRRIHGISSKKRYEFERLGVIIFDSKVADAILKQSQSGEHADRSVTDIALEAGAQIAQILTDYGI